MSYAMQMVTTNATTGPREDDADRTLFEIPVANFKKFEHQIAKLSRKAERIGYGPINALVVGKSLKEGGPDGDYEVIEVYFTESEIKIDGWRFQATLDHSQETGNVLRALPNVPALPDRFRTVKPFCEHCNVNRYRRDTYVMRCDETGDYKQIGRSCMNDFFGHDPNKLIRQAEILGYAVEAARGFEQVRGTDRRWISTEGFAKVVAAIIRMQGCYVSRKMVQENPTLIATADQARLGYGFGRSEIEIIDEDRDTARAALEWAEGLRDKADKSEWEHNVCVIAGSVAIEFRSEGLLTSIVGVYVNNKKREAERLARSQAEAGKAVKRASQHVGKTGERLRDLAVTVTWVFEREPNDRERGVYIYKFVTAEGDLLTWFASKRQRHIQQGLAGTLIGTVINHKTNDRRDNEKFTVLNRVEFTAV